MKTGPFPALPDATVSPIRWCQTIIKAFDYVSDSTAETIRRTYAKTYSIVTLYNEGLVRPTEDASGRLCDLYHAIKAEWVTQGNHP